MKTFQNRDFLMRTCYIYGMGCIIFNRLIYLFIEKNDEYQVFSCILVSLMRESYSFRPLSLDHYSFGLFCPLI